MNPYDHPISRDKNPLKSGPVDQAVSDGVRQAIAGIVNAARTDGTGMTRRSWPDGSSDVYETPRDWRDGIIAAQRIERDAREQMIEMVMRARGEGISWRDLAVVFGISGRSSESDDANSTAETTWASFQKAMGNTMLYEWTSIRWDCAGCCQKITDHGPFADDPVEEEIGHADGCPTFAATVAARGAIRQEQA